MAFSSTSRAAANAVGAKNVQFVPQATNLPRKILIVANYDETSKTSIVENTLYKVTSAADAGNRFGFGFAAHRLAMKSFVGSQGIPTYVCPVDWDAVSTVGTQTLTIVATSTSAGVLYLRISGEEVFVTITKGMDETAVAAAIVAAVTADTDLPVTAGNLAGVVTFTSKDKNTSANAISLTLNYGQGEELPDGLTSATLGGATLAGGTGVMNQSMTIALETALGSGDASNSQGFTDLCHGWGDTTAVLDDISEYNGEGDTFQGCWAKEVHKPLRSLCGDVVAGSGGLTAALALGAARAELDRTNGQISVPGSPSHPDEIAAVAIGIMARINNNNPAEHMVGQVLTGVLPGALAEDWCTQDYDNRDAALKAGISPTVAVSGTVQMQNVATFYHPAGVDFDSNGYRSQVSISKMQNILNSYYTNFERDFWKGNALVDDVTKVTNPTAKRKAKDSNNVLADVIALLQAWEALAWIYQAEFSINLMTTEKATRITIRGGTTGWDVVIPLILSGEAATLGTEIEFDTSIAALS
jgi:phage tail sheath gpL-like